MDFKAPSRHKFQLADKSMTLQKSNSYAAPYVTAIIGQLLTEKPKMNVCQIKNQLYRKFGEKCVQYVPDWIEKGWIGGKILDSKADVYFDVVESAEDADTVILYDVNELEKYRDKHIVYLGRKMIEQPDTQHFFWNGQNREKQIVFSKLQKEIISIPILILEFDNGQDDIWWLMELRKYFERDGYNAYTASVEQESVLFDLEYIPLNANRSVKNKIYDFIYWQTYYNQSDLVIYGIKENEKEKESLIEYADILIKIGNKDKKTDIQVYCEKIKKMQVCFETIGEQEIREMYNHLIVFLTEDEDEQ